MRHAGSDIEPFFLNATTGDFRDKLTAKGKDVSWQATTWRPMLLIFYVGLTAIGVVVAVATN